MTTTSPAAVSSRRSFVTPAAGSPGGEPDTKRVKSQCGSLLLARSHHCLCAVLFAAAEDRVAVGSVVSLLRELVTAVLPSVPWICLVARVMSPLRTAAVLTIGSCHRAFALGFGSGDCMSKIKVVAEPLKPLAAVGAAAG